MGRNGSLPDTYQLAIGWKIIIIIIYPDFSLHKGGVVMPSRITHTIINIHPLAHILDICAMIFSSCSLFAVYPNRIM